MAKKKQKKPKNITPQQWKEFWEEHLPYEIDMMRLIYPIALVGNDSVAIHNAMVETLMLHCRNLVEFFKHKPPCDFSPAHFTDTSFKVNRTFINEGLYNKMNQQVSHLTAERTSTPKDKLGPDQWKKIVDAIESEIARMERSLLPERRATWKYNQTLVLRVGPAFGASSEPFSISTSSDFAKE